MSQFDGSVIRSLWDGDLSDAVKERFAVFKEHLTPPSFEEKEDASRIRCLREGQRTSSDGNGAE